jgi:hypothetical protein
MDGRTHAKNLIPIILKKVIAGKKQADRAKE